MFKGFRGTWLRGTRDPMQAALGHLERAVMDTVWQGGPCSVRDVQGKLAKPVAYTTVMTTLDRLYKKGLVQRRREGRAFLYTAALERHELEATMTTGLLNGMLSGGSERGASVSLQPRRRRRRQRRRPARRTRAARAREARASGRTIGRREEPSVTVLLSSLLLGFAWFAALRDCGGAAGLGAGAPGAAPPAIERGVRCWGCGCSRAPSRRSSCSTMFMPSHWRFEPARTDETFGVVLGGLALAGVWLDRPRPVSCRAPHLAGLPACCRRPARCVADCRRRLRSAWVAGRGAGRHPASARHHRLRRARGVDPVGARDRHLA